MKISLLDKYIFKQVTVATLLGLLIFIIVWISPEILFKIIKQLVNNQITSITAFKLLIYEIPEILGKAIPVGLLIGCLSVFDKLSRDSEITIFRSIGISFWRIILPVFVLGTISVFACFYVYEKMIPTSNLAIKNIKNNVNNSHFVYMDKTKSGKPSNIIIIGDYNGKIANNIKFLQFSNSVSTNEPLIKTIITADNALWQNNHWELNQGIEYKIAPDGVYKEINSFEKKNVLFGEPAVKSFKLLNFSRKKTSELNLSQIKYYLNLLKSVDMMDEYRYMLNKYHQRFALPFSCVLFSICGVVLGFTKPRKKRFWGFTIGVALVFLYYILIPFLDILAQVGALSPFITAWIPNFIIFLAAITAVKLKEI